MSSDENEQSWQEHLMLACTAMADTRDQEEEIFRQEANKAPLGELRIFLASPGGKYDGHARAVMGEVLRQREVDIARRESLKNERRKFYLKVLGGIVVSTVVGVGGYYFPEILPWN